MIKCTLEQQVKQSRSLRLFLHSNHRAILLRVYMNKITILAKATRASATSLWMRVLYLYETSRKRETLSIKRKCPNHQTLGYWLAKARACFIFSIRFCKCLFWFVNSSTRVCASRSSLCNFLFSVFNSSSSFSDSSDSVL